MNTRHHYACLVLSLVLSGCSLWTPGQHIKKHFDLGKNIPWGAGAEGKFTRAMKIISVWQYTVLHQDGQPPVRGFGGRVWFYGKEGEKPVEVEGTLEVYAFDETNRDPTNITPDRKYVFTPEEFQKHHGENSLGHSYNFWLPWGDVNGPELEFSLIARFTPVDGSGTIVGEATRHELPGREVALEPRKKPSMAQRAAKPYFHPNGQSAVYPHGPAYGPYGPYSEGYVVPASGMVPASQWMPPYPMNQQPRLKVETFDVPSQFGRSTPFTSNLSAATPYSAAHAAGHGEPAYHYPAAQAAITPPVNPQALNSPPPQAGYPLGTRRALGAPIERVSRDHNPWQPYPVRPLYGPGFGPQSGNGPGPAGYPPASSGGR
jgi:hypothetical protein